MKPDTIKHEIPVPALPYRIAQGMMWPLLKVMGLSCRQFAELCAIRLDRPLTRGERIRFRFHRAMCGACRRLPDQFEALRALVRCSCADGECHRHEEPELELKPEAARRIRDALARESGDPYP